MTRRKRQKRQRQKDTDMAAPTIKKKTTTEGVPLNEIRELAKRFRMVNAKVCRRNERGTLQTIYGKISIDIDDFPFIEDWLKDKAGGGRYELELYNPDDAFDLLVPRFVVFVEGRPHAVKDLSRPGGAGPGSEPTPSYRQLPASYVAGAKDVAPPPGYGDRPAPGATIASDEMAMRVIGDLKANLEALRVQAQKDKEALEEKLKRREDELTAERARAQETRHEAQMKALESKLEALATVKAQPAAKATGLPELLASVGPLAPVLAALVKANKESSLESLRMQQTSMQNFMNMTLGQANRPDQMMETIKGLAPLVMPFIQQLLQQRGPEAQVAMFEAMSNNQLNQASMVAQLIEMMFQSNATEEQSAWLPVVRQMLAGGVEAMEAWASSKGSIPGQQLPPPGPIGYQPGQAVPQAVRQAQSGGGFTTVSVDDDGVTTEVKSKDTPKGRVIDIDPTKTPPQLKLIMSMMPSAFQTPEWRQILTIIHQDPPPPAAEVAELVFVHLDHLDRFGLLPEQLDDFFESPRERMQAMLERLPVWRTNGKYAVALIDATLELIQEQQAADETDDDREEDNEPEEIDGEVRTESFGDSEANADPKPAVAVVEQQTA